LGIDSNLIGDQIYNGFYDNAMGVASLLSIAEELAENWFDMQNTRGIIFLLTTGEEKGLLGSRFFTDNLPVPYEKVIANVNIDGIAAFGEPNGYYVLGGNYSWLGEYADEVLGDNGKYRDEIDEIYGKDDFFRYSDQFAFAIAGIPSVQIVDGLDYVGQSRSSIARKALYYSQNYYHTPHDEPIIGYRLSGVESHTTLILEYMKKILETGKNISWLKNSPYRRKLQESLTFD
jgi:Zn-dependent M28 family amino/carboxypeptidase